MGIYHMARMVYLLGNPELATVSGSAFQELPMDEKRKKESGYNVEEFGTGFIRFKNNVSMFMEEAWAAHAAGGDGDQLLGSLGGIRLEPFTFYRDLYGMDSDITFNVDSYLSRQRSLGYYDPRGMTGSQEHFVYGVQDRVEMIDTGAIALTVAKITQALYDSHDAGKEVSF